jgi:transposase-like protein
MTTPPVSYKNHRFPPPIIAHAVWLYFRFPLSLRLVEEMLLERGIIASYEAIWRWGRKFGPAYAKQPVAGDLRATTFGIWTRLRFRSQKTLALACR